MTRMGKVLTLLGVVAALGTPVAVYAATRTGEATTAKDDTIVCPITGEPIKPCCCPLQKD